MGGLIPKDFSQQDYRYFFRADQRKPLFLNNEKKDTPLYFFMFILIISTLKILSFNEPKNF